MTSARTITGERRASASSGRGRYVAPPALPAERTVRARPSERQNAKCLEEGIPGLRGGLVRYSERNELRRIAERTCKSGVASASCPWTGSFLAGSVFGLRSDATGKGPDCPPKERSAPLRGRRCRVSDF